MDPPPAPFASVRPTPHGIAGVFLRPRVTTEPEAGSINRVDGRHDVAHLVAIGLPCSRGGSSRGDVYAIFGRHEPSADAPVPVGPGGQRDPSGRYGGPDDAPAGAAAPGLLPTDARLRRPPPRSRRARTTPEGPAQRRRKWPPRSLTGEWMVSQSRGTRGRSVLRHLIPPADSPGGVTIHYGR